MENYFSLFSRQSVNNERSDCSPVLGL